MKRNQAISILVAATCAVLLIALLLHLRRQRDSDTTLAICRIVRDCYLSDALQSEKDGYQDGPGSLRKRLLTSVQQDGLLTGYQAMHGDEIVDAWGNPIWVIKAGSGVHVHSAGPDGIRQTGDDVELR